MSEPTWEPGLPPLVEMDCYDAIEIVTARQDAPSRLLGDTARSVADLWNDPPFSCLQRDQVAEVFPELAAALGELLGGGPVSTAPWQEPDDRTVDDVDC